MNLNDDLLLRYSRHILLPDVGVAGQTRIANASVLIVGAGGLGCPVALYLGAAELGGCYWRMVTWLISLICSVRSRTPLRPLA